MCNIKIGCKGTNNYPTKKKKKMPKCHIFKDKIDIKKGFIRLAHYLQ